MKILFISETREILANLIFLRLESRPAFMHDAAPVFLGSAGDLFHIAKDAVSIAAVHAAQFFQAIEISQLIAIPDQDIFRALYPIDPVYRETDELIESACQIKGDDERQRQPDERHCQPMKPETGRFIFAIIHRIEVYQGAAQIAKLGGCRRKQDSWSKKAATLKEAAFAWLKAMNPFIKNQLLI